MDPHTNGQLTSEKCAYIIQWKEYFGDGNVKHLNCGGGYMDTKSVKTL